ncbi:MAG: AMP-binding protein, partial [Aquihabitans sp.]
MAEPVTIPQVLDRAAREWPDVIALIGEDGIRWTFAELATEADVVARALIASGVAPGDRVAIWAPNSLRWVATSFGIYRAGAVLVPLNSRYRGAEAA